MSEQMSVYLVDWADFQARVLHSDVCEVIEEMEMQSEPLLWASFHSQMLFMDSFDSFQRAWKSDAKLHFKEVFDAMFASWRGGKYLIMELVQGEDEDSDLDGIDTAMKPETVREFVEEASRFNLEDCCHLFEKHVKQHNGFDSFDKWKSYGEEWIDLLKRASQEDKGLIVVAFG